MCCVLQAANAAGNRPEPAPIDISQGVSHFIYRLSDWSVGMSAGCKPWVQLFIDAGNGWPHSAQRYH